MTTSIESVHRIEPCFLDTYDEAIADLLVEVPRAAARLGDRLHPMTATSLADLVRLMNCYYSNLIEGHDTRPREIERALANDLESGTRRDLQLEARAHVRVQAEIDRRHREGTLGEPASSDFITWMHAEFYRDAPTSMLDLGADRVMLPGRFRTDAADDNAVGRHVPPSSARVAAFMKHFAQRYTLAPLGPSSRLVAMATAHHRFNYVHPFPDGNGRVSRLMSHAMGLEAGIGAHGLWSISRGLARGLESRLEYKAAMDAADAARTSDTDGRGNLSLRALRDFVLWFLRVALDQITFMGELFDLSGMKRRLVAYVDREGLRPEAARLLDEALVRGELARGDASRITGLGERASRDVLAELLARGVLASSTPKGPVSLRFTTEASEVLFPKLFPVS